MGKKTVIKTGDISNVRGQVVVGIKNKPTQTVSTLSASDKKELMDNLIEFRKEIPTLNLSLDEQSIIHGKVTETIKEAEKQEPDFPKIKSLYTSAIETIKGAGSAIEKLAASETAKRISELLGFGLSILRK